MNAKEKFIAMISNEPLKKADAIVVLEGDGFYRLAKAKRLFNENWSKLIVISGGIDKKECGSFPVESMKEKLVGAVSENCIILEKRSTNTHEQALEVINMALQNKWKRIILVASHYHQFRAFLTFLKVAQERDKELEIINAPARDLEWFAKNPWGSRFDLLDSEFEKIDTYQKKGLTATFQEAINYQKWKENLK